MKINPEAQLAVKLYRAMQAKYRKLGLTSFDEMAEERHSLLDAAKLCSLARAIHRIDETYCNRTLTNREVARNVKLNEAVRGLAAQYGLKVTRNHDPRGFAVYLHFPDSSYNSWGGPETGWGI